MQRERRTVPTPTNGLRANLRKIGARCIHCRGLFGVPGLRRQGVGLICCGHVAHDMCRDMARTQRDSCPGCYHVSKDCIAQGCTRTGLPPRPQRKADDEQIVPSACLFALHLSAVTATTLVAFWLFTLPFALGLTTRVF